IVNQNNPNRHLIITIRLHWFTLKDEDVGTSARTNQPPRVLGPLSKVPPTAVTRSSMPWRPIPVPLFLLFGAPSPHPSSDTSTSMQPFNYSRITSTIAYGHTCIRWYTT